MLESLTQQQFQFLSRFLKENSGYQLDADKEYILHTRLPGILNQTGCMSADHLLSMLKEQPEGSAASVVLQSMTINETMFFRDQTPFLNIKNHILPALADSSKQPRHITFWSAACSSGQEPYSLAMTLDSVRHLYPNWSFSILASDLNEDMLSRAREGLYSDFEIQRGLPDDMRERYFMQENRQWRIHDDIRKMVEFTPVNLLRIPRNIGPFDVILCRNVLFYFDSVQKNEILSSLRRLSGRNGYLILGSSESISHNNAEYAYHPEWKGVYVAH
jgi:chemotaxis protein methyltransferase CheR